MSNVHPVVNKLDFICICRICLRKNQDYSAINNNIINALLSLTNINIRLNDGLPKNLCKECTDKIYECVDFKQKCIESNRILHEINNSFGNNIKIEKVDIKQEENYDFESKNSVGSENNKNTANENTDSNKKGEHLNFETVRKDDDEISENHFEDEPKDEEEDDNLDFKLPSGGKRTASLRQIRINWVMTLGADKCDINKILCVLCNKSFVNLSSLGRHMETHDINRKIIISCNICQKGFYEKGNYTKHMKRHNLEYKYKCKECDKNFYELNLLTAHVQKLHESKPVICKECGKAFIVEEQLQMHMMRHKNEYPYVCNKCGKGYHLQNKLNEHLLKHKKRYICEICNKTYKCYGSLKCHNDRYHVKGVQTKECDICGKLVKCLKQHMTSHAENRKINCSECSRTFLTRSGLITHKRRVHEGITQPLPYLCNLCGKRVRSRSTLKVHLINVHTNEKSYKCHICNNGFKSDFALKKHVRHRHEHVRNYKCNICEKRFTTNSILTVHLRTHTGERPYNCHICNRAFAQRITLKTHLKVHSKADYE